MAYKLEDQELDDITCKLLSNLQEYRARAESRMMDKSSWNLTHRLKLKKIVDSMLELQLEINEL